MSLETDAEAALREHKWAVRTAAETVRPASAASAASELPEELRIGADLSGEVYQMLCDKLDRLWLGRDEFSLVDDEEYAELGYSADDPYGDLVMKRASDGAFFELDIDLSVRRVEAKQAAS